jgi:hypothetical protein
VGIGLIPLQAVSNQPTHMHNDKILRAIADPDGNAIIHQGLAPALFISNEQLARWACASEEPTPIAIRSPKGIAIIAVMFFADAQLSVPKRVRPPSILPDDLWLVFTLPNKTEVGYCSRDSVIQTDGDWFVQEDFDLVVGPNTSTSGLGAFKVLGNSTVKGCLIHADRLKKTARKLPKGDLAFPMPEILRAAQSAVSANRSHFTGQTNDQ